MTAAHELDDETTPPPDDPAPTQKAVLRHRRGSRWMHWINFPLIVIMLWSGFRIYWAEQEWAFGILDWEWFAFFPDWVNEPLGFNRKLARGLAFHLSFGWFFAINGIAYGIYTAVTGEWRNLVPSREACRRIPATVLHDLGLRKEAPPKSTHYNAAQQATYSFIVFMGAIALLTGFALFKPTQLSFLVTIFGGYSSARLIHFTVSIIFILFFVVHMVQVARAGRRNFTSMVTGYEVVDIDPAAGDTADTDHDDDHASPTEDGTDDRGSDAGSVGDDKELTHV